MMGAGDHAQFSQRSWLCQNALSIIWMQSHTFPVGLAQWSGLSPYPCRDADAANIMQMTRAAEQCHFGVRKVALLPGFFRQCANSRGMADTERSLQIGKVSKRVCGGFHLPIVQHTVWAWFASQHFLSQ